MNRPGDVLVPSFPVLDELRFGQERLGGDGAAVPAQDARFGLLERHHT